MCAWDATKPAAAEAKNLFPAQAQGNWDALEDWLNDLGNFPTTPAAFNAGVVGLTFISSATASTSATVDFTSGLTSTYDTYLITLMDVFSASDAVDLWMRVSQSAAFKSGASDYNYSGHESLADATSADFGSTAASEMIVQRKCSTSNRPNHVNIWISSPSTGVGNKLFIFDGVHIASDNTFTRSSGGGVFALNTTAIDGVRFRMSAGDITSGQFTLYGVRKV